MRLYDLSTFAALGALAYAVHRLNGRVTHMETKTQALLREVGETVASNSDVLASNNRLLTDMTALLLKVKDGQNGGEGATDEELDSAAASLQAVQDANTAAKAQNDAAAASIEAVLNPATGSDTGNGDTGTSSSSPTSGSTGSGSSTDTGTSAGTTTDEGSETGSTL